MLDHPALATTDVSSLRIAATGAARCPPSWSPRCGPPRLPGRGALREHGGVPRHRHPLDDPDDDIAPRSGARVAASSCRWSATTARSCRRSRRPGALPVGRGDARLLERPRAHRGGDRPRRLASHGDLGWLGDDGNLRLAGRASEMYIRGGYNVYPRRSRTARRAPGAGAIGGRRWPDPVSARWARHGWCPRPAPHRRPTSSGRSVRARLADYKAPDRVRSSTTCRSPRWSRPTSGSWHARSGGASR